MSILIDNHSTVKIIIFGVAGDLRECSSHMLRREDELLRDWRSEKALNEPEVRYMALSCQTIDSSSFVYAVASDGIIR